MTALINKLKTMSIRIYKLLKVKKWNYVAYILELRMGRMGLNHKAKHKKVQLSSTLIIEIT